MFEYKPDFEQARARYNAWWRGEILDRPPVSLVFPKPTKQQVPTPQPPPKTYASLRDRWLDPERAVAGFSAWAVNQVFYAEAIPSFYPNLGPEIFSAYYGCELEFGESTSWSVPCLADWNVESLARLRFNPDGFWFKKTLEMMDAAIEAAKGKFIVGYTDMHPGMDALAAFRNPQDLCVDVLEVPEKVKALAERITGDFLKVYDIFYERLSRAGMPSTSWLNAIGPGKYHIPSCDFSCMISDAQFEELCLPSIERECAHMDCCIYHLDGPQALRFLDRILDIPTIQAIQWVPGAGHDGWREQIPVYRRIQERKKSLVAYVPPKDVAEFTRLLRPQGVWICAGGVANQAEADAVLDVVRRWT
jgi:hypothetical protein